jgi:regulation of enolase protein 1 (concanavalin A-like superfamily)
MSRLVGSLVALVLISTALAAPAPQPFKAGWHNPVDPNKDCKFIREKGSLTIEVPGTDHDFYPLRERLNAPRLLRDIEGDFEMQVRVQIDCRPSLTSTVKDQPSLVAAGFLLIPPAPFTVTCIRLEYGLVRDGTRTDGYAALRHQGTKKGRSNARWGSEWKNWPLPEKTDRAYLRLVRQGETFYPSISPDGKKWALLVGGAGYVGLPKKLKVGLAAYSFSTEPSKVRFDQFKLTLGQRKGR